jgi:site-specific DNA-cytosine methylase
MVLADVAKVRGMAQVAKDAGLHRKPLHQALRKGSTPRFEAITAIMRALTVKMALVTKQAHCEPQKTQRAPSLTPVAVSAYCGNLSSMPLTYQFMPKIMPSSTFSTTVPSCLVILPPKGNSLPVLMASAVSAAILATSSGKLV